MCVCVCVSVCVCMYACMYVCMYVCVVYCRITKTLELRECYKIFEGVFHSKYLFQIVFLSCFHLISSNLSVCLKS